MALVVFGLLGSLARAGNLPARFTLGRYIPADVWIYWHAVDNPERAWIGEQWDEVWTALKQTGIHQDIIELVLSKVGAEQRAEFDEHVSKVSDLAAGVRWDDLFGGEIAFARGPEMPLMEPILLTRGTGGSAEANIKGLVAILNHLASMGDAISVKPQKIHGADVWSLTVGECPFAIELFRKGEIIGMTTSRKTTNDLLGRMAGAGTEQQAITDARRFKEALSAVRSPEDSLLFVDLKMFLQGVGQFVDSVNAASAPEAGGAEWAQSADKVLKLCDFVDYIIMTMETDGHRELSHTLVKAQENRMNTPIARMCLQRQPFQKFDTYIPAEAVGFSLNGLIDLALLYRTILDFVENDVPGGAELINQLNATLAGIGFDPKGDLLSWWSGEIISVQMPAAVVTPMGGGDSVTMIRVKDPKLATEKVNKAINWANTNLQAKGQMLAVAPAEVNAEGFRKITYPPMAMFLNPVVGVKDEWLFIGTSTGAVNKCLAVASGKAPSILKNERFKKEGIVPRGPVQNASFSDLSNLGPEMAQILGMLVMGTGMATAGMPDEGETAEVKQLTLLPPLC